MKKGGGQKILCNINTCPASRCCTIKPTDKNAISNDLETPYFVMESLESLFCYGVSILLWLGANYCGALCPPPKQNLTDVFFPMLATIIGQYD